MSTPSKPGPQPKPTSMILWMPDDEDPAVIWSWWFGALWKYTLYWGDGAETPMLPTSPAAKHTYAKPGTYDVVGVSRLHETWTASAHVTIRDFLTPPQPGSSLDGNRVTLTFPAVPDPARWLVEWGDGEITEHTGTSAEHTYPWNFGTPEITVTDVPSRRTVRFTGPEIGPDPTPPDIPVDGFLVRYLYEHSGGWVFEMLGGGLEPGDEVWFYPYRSWGGAVTLTADELGRVRHVFTHYKSSLGHSHDDVWRSYTIWHKTSGYQFLPVQPVLMAKDEPQVTYTISPSNPLDVTISVYPPQVGTHSVHFGDGFDARAEVKQLPLKVPHNYAYKRPDRPITVFLPDGRKAERSFGSPDPCSPCFNPSYPGETTIIWYRHAAPRGCEAPCGGDTEAFAPLHIENGGVHPPHVLHKPNNTDGWGTGYLYRGFSPGFYSFRYLGFDWDRRKGIEIPKGARSHLTPDSDVIIEDAPGGSEITAWFGDVTEWDGGYSGKFHVMNHGQEAQRWEIEFHLQEPAVLRDVWPSSAQYRDLGGGRWRIWSNSPLAPSTDVAVGARVEPPGKTRKFPDEIRGRTWTPPPPEEGEQ